MRKVQILFPEPQLRKLREVARREDRPLSEVIRRAADAYLEMLPVGRERPRELRIPVFDGGSVLVGPEKLRELAYVERTSQRKRRGRRP
jgi:Ribbon-helix-helix protein, copG family